MELLNATKMKAGYTMGLKPDGRELLVVVVKGTFKIPLGPEEPQLAEQQADLVMADEFTGEPGFSAPKYESDFAPFKPRCDVLLNGSAYAPAGEPVKRVKVGLRVGSMEKRFSVVGNRYWRNWFGFIWRTSPEEFVKMPISYDNAFGGVDRSNEKRERFFVANPAGRGYHYHLRRKAVHGKPLPNTEQNGRTVRWPRSKRHRPMAFGPIGRGWQPRPKLAGTYDQNWIDNVFPFLPADFDDRYYQCAPVEQQIDYLRGGEGVSLLNLTPDNRRSFRLPAIQLPVTFYPKRGHEKELVPACDTLIVEPDLGCFIMVWRAALQLKRNMFEVGQIIVGRMPRAYYRARQLGKTWYPSLKELV
ncbi:MAG TPA: DUF2169 domain-containing protein, partial [Candidatus Dormibacteraeota bacterium]|nr:DUF2169 domain-containing protein [Candidatus Dormibacteraeota bacterium]